MVRTSFPLLALLLAGAAAAQDTPPPGQIAPFPRAEDPPASAGAPRSGGDRPLDREETPAERTRRESGVFDPQGRIDDQRSQIERRPGVVTDSLRRGQSPSYSVGPGVNIIRRP